MQPVTVKQHELSLYRLPPRMLKRRYTELLDHVMTEEELGWQKDGFPPGIPRVKLAPS
jgi:hypothetical protein